MRVDQCRRYPVKSMQGFAVDDVEVGMAGVHNDRRWALIDVETGKLASAKRFSKLLSAAGTDDAVILSNGQRVGFDDADRDEVLSGWLGRPMRLAEVSPSTSVVYQMTFEPPNDEAELFDIPAPAGTFLDLAPLHLITTGTLRACRNARPDLDWDVRRFRPNIVVESGDDEMFGEDTWAGHNVRIGEVEIAVTQPAVRCAMPLRAQPGLERQPGLFAAMSELNTGHPNHLGVYATVTQPGTISVNDPAEVLP